MSMGMWVGRGRKARAAYGFDDIALVPGAVTVNPNEVDISWDLGGRRFEIPIMAAAMDGVVGPRLAIEMGRLGGLAVLNLEGIFARYADPAQVLDRIVSASQEEATKLIQSIYGEPIKEELIHKRITEIKKGGGAVAVSSIPQRAARFAQIAQEAGADLFVVQSTVTTARHIATEYVPVDFRSLKKQLAIPLVVGNVVTYDACLELMECGADALLVGVGPGAACTSREVLGLGVPQVTATADSAAARDFFYKKTGRYVPIITDGGMTTGGDVCKALASGADAVMIGSAFARATEAPGRGYHWGMATPHQYLPRGTRIRVGVAGSLEQILFGPAFTEDGTLNLVGAIRTCMGSVGARNIRELQLTELIIAPAIKTEGKVFQQAQKLGRPR
jgi:IMP dehydrogenase